MYPKLKKINVINNGDGTKEIRLDWSNERHHSVLIPKDCEFVDLKNSLLTLAGQVMNDRSLRTEYSEELENVDEPPI